MADQRLISVVYFPTHSKIKTVASETSKTWLSIALSLIGGKKFLRQHDYHSRWKACVQSAVWGPGSHTGSGGSIGDPCSLLLLSAWWGRCSQGGILSFLLKEPPQRGPSEGSPELTGSSITCTTGDPSTDPLTRPSVSAQSPALPLKGTRGPFLGSRVLLPTRNP